MPRHAGTDVDNADNALPATLLQRPSHCTAKKIERHIVNTRHKRQCSEIGTKKGRIWNIIVLQPSKLVCQMQS